jgi:SAM-dependent methyltransferase
VSDRYAIRPDYRARPAQHSLDVEDDDAYWTPARLALSGDWQYYVYRLARELVLHSGAKNMMDVGSGPGTKVRDLIAPLGVDVVLVDQPSTRAVAERTLPGAAFVAADLSEIDLALGRRFDVIVCSDVVEHLLDPDPCVAFVREHLNVGGRAVFSTPDRERLRGRECLESPHPEHVREWSGPEFRTYLESRDYVVEQQLWLPARRTHPLDFAAGRVLGGVLPLRRWTSCQAVVARARVLGRTQG